MKTLKLTAAAAVALTLCAAQPASATMPRAPVAASSATTILTMAWAVGFFVCTGMTWGKMQVDAQKQHRALTGADAFRGIGRCLFPPIGFADLMQGR